MKIPKRNIDDEDDNDYDVTKGWYDPVQDKFIEPQNVDWVPLDILYGNERHYVAGHAALAGYEWGSAAGTIGGVFFWLMTKHLPAYNTDSLTVDSPFQRTATTPSSTAADASTNNVYATKSKKQQPQTPQSRLPVSHIQAIRKPWHFLVQRMATGGLMGGALGATLGLISLYRQPHTCPLRRVLYQEQTLPMPDEEQREELDRLTFFPITFYHSELIRQNFQTRMLESGVTLGFMGGVFSMAAEEGPVWLGLARGWFGVVQAVSLGGTFGFGAGWMVVWYINNLVRQWNEQQQLQQTEASGGEDAQDGEDAVATRD